MKNTNPCAAHSSSVQINPQGIIAKSESPKASHTTVRTVSGTKKFSKAAIPPRWRSRLQRALARLPEEKTQLDECLHDSEPWRSSIAEPDMSYFSDFWEGTPRSGEDETPR